MVIVDRTECRRVCGTLSLVSVGSSFFGRPAPPFVPVFWQDFGCRPLDECHGYRARRCGRRILRLRPLQAAAYESYTVPRGRTKEYPAVARWFRAGAPVGMRLHRIASPQKIEKKNVRDPQIVRFAFPWRGASTQSAGAWSIHTCPVHPEPNTRCLLVRGTVL